MSDDDCLACAFNKPKEKYVLPLRNEKGRIIPDECIVIDAEVIDSLVGKSTSKKGMSILIKKGGG